MDLILLIHGSSKVVTFQFKKAQQEKHFVTKLQRQVYGKDALYIFLATEKLQPCGVHLLERSFQLTTPRCDAIEARQMGCINILNGDML